MTWQKTIGVLALALVFWATMGRAQDQQQNAQPTDPIFPTAPLSAGGASGYNKPPAPAARGVSSEYDAQVYDRAQAIPDMNTLSGAQLFGLGNLGHAHDIFVPSFSLTEQGQTAPATGTQSSLSSQTYLHGILDFDRTWSIHHLTALYNGGASFDSGPPSSHWLDHNLIISEQMGWERWRLLLRDDFAASPGAAFTGTGMGGPGMIAQLSSTFGATLSSIGQAFVPSESIQTGNANRYRNTVLGEAEYSFSRRSAFTFSSSYGILQFSDAGYISSRMLNAQAGYDYLLDPKDSIAIVASYGDIYFPGLANTNSKAYSAGVAFGRKITGRVAFQVEAGPQLIHSGMGTQNFDRWFESVNGGLTYDRRRSGVSITYMRGLSGGSGVYAGSTTNTFSASAHHQFTRYWTGTASGGYALNHSLSPAGAPTTSFNNWFVGANLGRHVGRQASMNFLYGLQKQDSPSICPVASCGGSGFQHSFGMTVNWHLRPNG
jgi:hypothetical protein